MTAFAFPFVFSSRFSRCDSFFLSLLAGGLLLSAPLQAEIFKCTDQSGHVTYSNVTSRGCQRLYLPPETHVPPPATPRPRQAGSAGASGSGGPSVSVASTTPGGFPKVDTDTQRTRDNDRRRILEQELANEQRGLAQARAELAQVESTSRSDPRLNERTQPYRDRIAQHERNLQAINRELGNNR